MQLPTVRARCGEIAVILGVMPGVGVVGRHIGCVGGDGDRGGEADLLPARRGLVGEGSGGERPPGARPERAGVLAGVLAALVEANPGDLAAAVRTELDAELGGTGI